MPSAEQRDEVEMLSLMLLIRRFEERASQQYQAQKIGGFCHLYIGQEAVVCGAVAATRHDDYIITAYRDHAHALARGTSPNACMAELFGKATGCSRGLGGSMHFFDRQNHMYGGHAIVGAHVVAMPNVVITHDCRVDDFATFAAGVALGGGVRVGRAAYLGMNSSVLPGRSIGAGATVGMGAVVLHDVPDHETWAGVPAHRLGETA